MIDPDDDHYFAVGPSLALRGTCRTQARQAKFDVLGPEGAPVGSLHWALHEPRATISPSEALLEHAGTHSPAEAVRLATRVLARRYGARIESIAVTIDDRLTREALDLLSEDGFTAWSTGGATGTLVTTRLVHERAPGERATDMDGVYADPFTIPWNFVPVETDLLTVLAREQPPSARVLDLGCGYGKNAQFLAGLGYEVWGVDVSRRAIERARAALPHPERFVTAPATDLPWERAFFDAVLDVGCLHCAAGPDRQAVVRESARVLRDGGRLFSRIFRPRPPQWLAAQPFETTSFGMQPDAAVSLLRVAFGEVDVDATDNIVYLTASSPRR